MKYVLATMLFVLVSQSRAAGRDEIFTDSFELLSPIPICDSFTAIPATIILGQSTVLEWRTTNAAEVHIDNDVGYVFPDGSITVFPTEDTTYTLVVFGEYTAVVCDVQVNVEKVGVVTTAVGATTIINDDGPNSGLFQIELEVTPTEEDIYIRIEPNLAFGYELQDELGEVAEGLQVASLVSSAECDGALYYIVREGETEVFRLDVMYTPETTDTIRLVVQSIMFKRNSRTTLQLPEADFRTPFLILN